MKKFKELKIGDNIFFIDEKDNYKVKKSKITYIRMHVYDKDINFTVSGKKEEFCLAGNWSRDGLICSEEKVATDFVEKVIKKKKLFATLKPGDTVYYANKKESSYGKTTVLGFNNNGNLVIGDSENEDKRSALYFTPHELYSNVLHDNCYRIRCNEWEKGHYTEVIFINEEDVKSYTEKIKKRLESKAISNYIDRVTNQGKPISFVDNKGNQLHYGDKVAYVRRNGLHAHTDISFGIIIGENRTKIKILDEEELKVGKPNADRWRRNEGQFLKSDGLHALEPQNIVFISSGEKKILEFGK